LNENLRRLSDAGVAIWLDGLSREQLRSGGLAALVREKHVVGVAASPAVFQRALGAGTSYDEQLRDLAIRRVTADEAIRMIAAADVREACDVLRPAYDMTDGADGRVSIDVDRRLGHKAAELAAEARQLSWLVDRPNLLISIPATAGGLPAVTATLAEGISVNVTLIPSVARYRAVTDAFFAGLERAADNGRDLSRIASVASVLVSPVDTEVDKRLWKIGTDQAAALRGKAAVAGARLVYAAFEEAFASERWKALEGGGARPQRPLWASTAMQDPYYPDTRYVDELVVQGVVSAMPEATLEMVADHGQITGDTVRGSYEDSWETFAALAGLGVSQDDVARALEGNDAGRPGASWSGLVSSVESALRRSPQASGVTAGG